MASQVLGVGVLGAAGIARKICRGISLTDMAEVVAVGSRDAAKSAAFIEECSLSGKATAYGSYDEVLNDPRVQAVYIPLPTSLHLEWVKKAAAKGKHVMLEKPISLTVEEGEAIVSVCREAGVQLMDGTMWTHNPRNAHMEAVIRDKERVGELREVSSMFAFMGSEDFFKNDIRCKAACDALGCLGDLGWYCIRAILWAYDFEAPTAVTAHGGSVYNEEGVPMHMGATLLFSGGRRGNFVCSFDRCLTQTLEVAGTKGTIRLDDFVIPKHELKCGFLATSSHGLRNLDTYDGTQSEEKIVYLEKPQEVTQWETFAACAAKGVDERWPHLALLTQKVCCAVLMSAKQGGMEIPFQP